MTSAASCAPVSPSSPAAAVLADAFALLADAGVSYCVLRNYDRLPEYHGNDVDMLVHPRHRRLAQRLFCQAAARQGWRLLTTVSRFGYFAQYFVPPTGRGSYLLIDLYTGLYWRGREYADRDFVLAGRQEHRGIYVAAPGVESATVLLKELLVHGKVKSRNNARPRIQEKAAGDPATFTGCLAPMLGKEMAKWLHARTVAAEWEAIEADVNHLRRHITRQALVRRPFGFLQDQLQFLCGHATDRLRAPLSARLKNFTPPKVEKKPIVSEWHVVKIAGRPRVALPAAARDVRAAVLSHATLTSLPRRIFSTALRMGIAFDLDRRLFPATRVLGPSQQSDLPARIEKIIGQLGLPHSHAGVLWPPQPDRGRVYVHLIDEDAQPRAFIKLSLDAQNDQRLLAEEAALLSLANLPDAPVATFRTPRILHAGQIDGRYHLALESLPAHLRPVRPTWDSFPDEALRQFAGPVHQLPGEAVRRLSWWERFCESVDAGHSFRQWAEAALEGPASVCRVHGDLGPGNILAGDGQLWIYDWEESSPRGPWRVDTVSYFIAIHWRRWFQPRGVLRQLLATYGCHRSREELNEILFSIAFLCGARFKAARQMAEVWDEVAGRWLAENNRTFSDGNRRAA